MRPSLDDTTKATIDHVLAVTRFNVGDGRVPEPDPDLPSIPYAVLHSGISSVFTGPDLTDPEGDATFEMQFRIVGDRADQVRALAELIARSLIGRLPSGELATPLEVPLHTVMGVSSVGIGAVRESGDLYQRDDDYAIHVSRS